MKVAIRLATIALFASLATAAVAQDPAACRLYTTSLVDAFLNPPGGGDEDFFTSKGSVPNVLFVIDNSCSMKWPLSLVPPNLDSCSGGQFDDAYSGYDSALHDPVLNPYPIYDPREPTWIYNSDEVYFWENRPNDGSTGKDIPTFCSSVSGTTSTCQTCLQTKGYYRDGNGDVWAVGNLLNYTPSRRWIIARKVLAELIQNVDNIRGGLMMFRWDSLSGTDQGARWITNSGLNPRCDMPGSNWPSNRATYLNDLYNRYDCYGGGACTMNAGTPLAHALWNVGEFYSHKEDALYDSWFGPGWTDGFAEGTAANQRSVCAACQFTSVVLITDGYPWENSSDFPPEIKNMAEGDLDSHGHGPLDCVFLGPGRCKSERLHKVAWWLQNHDLRPELPGKQSLNTYTVGFAYDDPLLNETAHQGDGKYFTASNAKQLADSILNIVGDIHRRSGTFTSTPLASVQSAATQPVLVPRFVPDSKVPWQGKLLRFDLVSEFALDVDLDHDGDYRSMFLVDNSCASVTDWSSPGGCKPIRAATSADVAAMPTLKLGEFYQMTAFDNPTLTTTPAEPFWDAGELLQLDSSDPKCHSDPDHPSENACVAPMERKIYTMVDVNNDGNIDRLDWAANGGSLVEFHPDNSTLLLPYLALESSQTCNDLFASGLLGADYATALDLCAKLLILWVRGCKLDVNLVTSGSFSSCQPRERVLADIFHSAPEILEPPTERMLLGTVFANDQSMVTLAHPTKDPFKPTGPVHAYDTFHETYRARPRIALVGSNGGMLHAFHVGHCVANCAAADVGKPLRHDRGTGKELWAFIPPDLLPKLHLMVDSSRHHYFVDGTTWIRTIWVDGFGGNPKDYKRQAGEYRTIAVISERRGGIHWTALDVTEAHSGDPAHDIRFLWMYPGIQDDLGFLAGESWSDLGPHPPPIGPVRYRDDASPVTAASGTHYRERWIVALPGGFDPLHNRGRGVSIVDAWTGETVKRWWFDPADSIRQEMLFSFAAVPALTSWGQADAKFTDFDPWFDTLVVGDTGGQVWVARMYEPDPAGWRMARVFQENKSDDPADRLDRKPFFQVASFFPLAESGLLRAFLGTGDRFHLRDSGAGVCSTNNPLVCARLGCKVETDFHFEPGGHGHHHGAKLDIEAEANDHGSTGWVSKKWQNVTGLSLGGSCGDFEMKNKVEIEHGRCGHGVEAEAELECTAGSVSGYQCALEHGEPFVHSDVPLSPPLTCAEVNAWPRDRFYSIRIFGGSLTPDLLDDPADPSKAQVFDANRLTTGGNRATEVVDASSVVTDAMGAGWYYEYQVPQERTATAGVTSGPCVVWATLEAEPAPACTGGGGGGPANPYAAACGSGGAQKAYTYFRNYIDGQKGCVQFPPSTVAWDATQDRMYTGSEPQPPPPPQVVTQVSKSGKVSTQVAPSTETGGEGVQVGAEEEILQEFTRIPVPADVHDVRHGRCGYDDSGNLPPGQIDVCQ
ncbi:MAG: hypothetical protein D6729_12265 [Deltaproteobacteria bacterium]|nr:MAG: hypothetical protein D6729_12265 [Deltaproteobacteria bacterium]